MPAVQLRDEQREDHRQQQRESRCGTSSGLHGEGQRQSAQPDYDGIRYERPGPLEPGDAEELRERPGHQNGHQNEHRERRPQHGSEHDDEQARPAERADQKILIQQRTHRPKVLRL